MKVESESTVNQATINARAEALEKSEAEAAAKGGKAGEEGKTGEPTTEEKAAADKATADKKAAEEKVAADKKAAEDAEAASKAGKKPSKKDPNDPEEMRKWATRTSQENSKLRKEMEELKEAQEKTFKLLSSLSKTPVDYKELAKSPEAIEKFIESERENMSAEFQEQLEKAAVEAKTKDTVIERMRRENDSENYPEWKRLYPMIQKIAMGPTGQGDPRVDFTKPAGEVLDTLYALALQENPKATEPEVKVDPTNSEKVYKESEMKAMLADMLAKEKDAIAKSAKEEALKEAQEALRAEAAGGTVASAGRGGGRVPTDHLAAFKKMSLAEQREWLQAQTANQG